MLEKRIEISEGKIKEIEEERRRLIEGMTSVSETKPISKIIHFPNNDVYDYLAKLDETENKPSTIMIPTKSDYTLVCTYS